MTGTRKIIRDTLAECALTVPELIEDLLQGCGTEFEIKDVLDSMLCAGEVKMEQGRLYLDNIEGATVHGTINESGDWEPMVSIPISEYEELLETKAMYEDLCK